VRQAAGELEAWKQKHQQGQLAKDAFDQQFSAVESQLRSCFVLCCQLAAAQQATGDSTWRCGLTELVEVRRLSALCFSSALGSALGCMVTFAWYGTSGHALPGMGSCRYVLNPYVTQPVLHAM
jgi:hypothetical protein